MLRTQQTTQGGMTAPRRSLFDVRVVGLSCLFALCAGGYTDAQAQTDYRIINGKAYPRGMVKFVQSGGYVANFRVSYEEYVNGRWARKTHTWNSATAGQTRQFNIAPGTRNINVFGEAYVFIKTTKVIFNKTYATAPNVTIKAYGTTLNRKFSETNGPAVKLPDASNTTSAPDIRLRPTYGSIRLNAGFTPDPFTKVLTAGGPIRTKLGGVSAYVAKAPDFQLDYTKGRYPLTIHAESTGDTTLLVQLPNGKWIANDDGGAGTNPLIRLPQPESGRYSIFVGTYGKKTARATLQITERSVTTATAPKTGNSVVNLVHKGGYVAKFDVTWTYNGKPYRYSSGSKALGWKQAVNIPAGATNLRLRAQAAVLVNTWRDIVNGAITPGTYEVFGTTLNRKWRRSGN